jgi:hypothetical protein
MVAAHQWPQKWHRGAKEYLHYVTIAAPQLPFQHYSTEELHMCSRLHHIHANCNAPTKDTL